jgi:superoxide reductase
MCFSIFYSQREKIAQGNTFRQFLKPNDKPEAFFKLRSDSITARAYCNLHGLWKGN